jgi:hypothetical protein
MPTISQEPLRNNVGEILRRAEAGEVSAEARIAQARAGCAPPSRRTRSSPSTRWSGIEEEPGGQAAMDGINGWISLFAGACQRAVSDADAYEERVRALQAEWRDRLGRVRKNSATELLLHALPGAPIMSVQSAVTLIGRSVQAVNEAIPRLLEAGVLKQTTVGRRNRAFEAAELIDSFTALERQLASPEADTLTSPPSRRVP